jgi:hypothetical protein
MAEKNVRVSTSFVTTGKRPMIVVRSGNKKTQYPATMHTTAAHAEAARKFVAKNFGKGATLTKIEDGQMGDRYVVTATPAPESETVPLTTESSR